MNFKDLPLGKKTKYPRNYDPSLLVALDRKEARNRVGIKLNSSSFYGLDSWTAYELSWLNSHGLPENSILYASYPSSSKNFIESKSFKLYLNSLNNKKIKKKNDLYELLKKDLGRCVSEEVEIEILNNPRRFVFDCISIDSLNLVNFKIKEQESKENKLKTSSQKVNEELSCSLFRSLCPVTGQPDWATIRIKYSGNLIEHESLLSYLISYRDHQAFHEDCVESIFQDLVVSCKPTDLTVQANYLRRGGIEINPVRSTNKDFNREILRESRQ